MPTNRSEPPIFDLASLDGTTLDSLARHYEEEGYCLLTGLKDFVTNLYLPAVMRSTGLSRTELETLLDPGTADLVLPPDLRQKLSRVSTDTDLADQLCWNLRTVLARLLGPVVHISRDFHVQFKCGATGRVGYGGYDSQQKFMEVHGAYQLHQDFTGASLPTSPSALILWTGLNDCASWPIRIYPGSHKLGLLCRQFVPIDHPSLSKLGDPLEIPARPGDGVMFNSLLLHGTGSAGAGRRVSCDIRFFPSCPYLKSTARTLVDSPAEFLEKRLAEETGPTLRAPLLENQAITGRMGENVEAEPHSILNWANYLNDVCNGEFSDSLLHLSRFANAELGLDRPEAYIEQFHQHPMEPNTLDRIRDLIGAQAVDEGEMD